MLKVGDPIPEFALMSDKVGEVSTKSLLGKRYVLFIYVQDDTSG